MPRIRTIKPEFWSDTKLRKMSDRTRLVFLCLISMADDLGRIEADAGTVCSFGNWLDTDEREDVCLALNELAKSGRIVKYEIDNNHYIAIPNFTKHQKIDHPTKSKIPEFNGVSGDFAKLRETSRNFAPDLDQGTGNREQGSTPPKPPRGASPPIGADVLADLPKDPLCHLPELAGFHEELRIAIKAAHPRSNLPPLGTKKWLAEREELLKLHTLDHFDADTIIRVLSWVFTEEEPSSVGFPGFRKIIRAISQLRKKMGDGRTKFEGALEKWEAEQPARDALRVNDAWPKPLEETPEEFERQCEQKRKHREAQAKLEHWEKY